jgi:hypothetical protein
MAVQVAEFVAHDSRLRFWSLNHARREAANALNLLPLVLLAFKFTRSRRNFYAQIERRSFHTAGPVAEAAKSLSSTSGCGQLSLFLAHRVISLRHEVWSLPGRSGHWSSPHQ